jgi:hypothetical protein
VEFAAGAAYLGKEVRQHGLGLLEGLLAVVLGFEADASRFGFGVPHEHVGLVDCLFDDVRLADEFLGVLPGPFQHLLGLLIGSGHERLALSHHPAGRSHLLGEVVAQAVEPVE